MRSTPIGTTAHKVCCVGGSGPFLLTMFSECECGIFSDDPVPDDDSQIFIRWRDGANYLIFNMLPGGPPHFNATPEFYYGKVCSWLVVVGYLGWGGVGEVGWGEGWGGVGYFRI